MTHTSPTVAAPAENLIPPVPAAAELVKKVRKDHPRLFALDADIQRLREKAKTDTALAAKIARLRQDGVKILEEPVLKHELPDGKRLLSVSRKMVDRALTLGLLYRLDGDVKWKDRLWTDAQAVANFKDWNPAHFLDTAEMSCGMGIAYDWFYSAWTKQQRDTLRSAIIRLGLNPGIEGYHGTGSNRGWWAKAPMNWNQVCNGGLLVGALAIADEEPQVAGEIMRYAITGLPFAITHYAPDGAWNEGPGYWGYATRYTVAALACLDTAVGKDFGLSLIPGFDKAGLFPIHLVAPGNMCFQFADAHMKGAIAAPEMLWLGKRFNAPAMTAYQLQQHRASPLDILWHPAKPVDAADLAAQPLAACFRRTEVVTMRSAWNDPAALFVGFKSGDNKVSHGHLDIGSFELVALGKRWAMDLGGDNYNMPAYFGNQRWTYYRCRAEGHNTLVINPGLDPEQKPRAAAKIDRFETSPTRTIASSDLTPVYDLPDGSSVVRGIAMVDGRQVIMRDELKLDKPSQVWWFMHTHARADLAPDGRSAVMTIDDQHLTVRLVSPAGAKLEVMDARPLPTSPNPAAQKLGGVDHSQPTPKPSVTATGEPHRAPSKSIHKLAIHLTDFSQGEIIVQFAPHWRTGTPATPGTPEVSPLAQQPIAKW